jgi:hypothetical protein
MIPSPCLFVVVVVEVLGLELGLALLGKCFIA